MCASSSTTARQSRRTSTSGTTASPTPTPRRHWYWRRARCARASTAGCRTGYASAARSPTRRGTRWPASTSTSTRTVRVVGVRSHRQRRSVRHRHAGAARPLSRPVPRRFFAAVVGGDVLAAAAELQQRDAARARRRRRARRARRDRRPLAAGGVDQRNRHRPQDAARRQRVRRRRRRHRQRTGRPRPGSHRGRRQLHVHRLAGGAGAHPCAGLQRGRPLPHRVVARGRHVRGGRHHRSPGRDSTAPASTCSSPRPRRSAERSTTTSSVHSPACACRPPPRRRSAR